MRQSDWHEFRDNDYVVNNEYIVSKCEENEKKGDWVKATKKV